MTAFFWMEKRLTRLTSGMRNPENFSLMVAATVFAGAVTFLQSSWAPYLVPQF